MVNNKVSGRSARRHGPCSGCFSIKSDIREKPCAICSRTNAKPIDVVNGVSVYTKKKDMYNSHTPNMKMTKVDNTKRRN